jgi:ribosome-associated protein
LAAQEIQITGDTIRLGQLLKLADVVDSGSDAKPLLAAGSVSVNGAVEERRGRQLHPGDVISVEGRELLIAGS